MGYESKFFAVKKYVIPSSIDGYNASEIVASLDMCKMGYSSLVTELLGLFNNKADFALMLPSYDEEKEAEVITDRIDDQYGAPICYIEDKERAIEIVKQLEKQDNYRRFRFLRKFIKMFKDDNDIYICHYGY